jgi:xanthine dehydrogenase YagT iron-sulfur-binding subunit
MEKANNKTGISRRQFLKEAGLILGGAALGPVSFASSCSPAATSSPNASSAGTVVTIPPASVLPSDVIRLNVNGTEYPLLVRPEWTLDFVLRERLGLFGTKVGCSIGECGSCTILSDGIPMLACLMLAVECPGLAIETIEGLSHGNQLHPVQQRFFDHEAFQCGFCTPGFIMAAKGLLSNNPAPTVQEVREALSGHICTCGNLAKTIEAVLGGKP